MWSRSAFQSARPFLQHARSITTTKSARIRATILGASTLAGIVAARILKTSDFIDHLHLHDDDTLVRATYHDLCDVDTACKLSAHVGSSDIKSALLDTDIVLVAVGRGGGGPVTPAQTLSDNIPLVREAVCAIATLCPCAPVVIASEPVNSVLPFAAEVLMQLESFHPNRLIGCSCEPLRAASLLSRVTGMSRHRTSVVVVGGRSPCTAVPVFSQARPWISFPDGVRDSIMDSMLSEARTLWCEQATSLANLPEGGFAIRGVAAAELVLKLARARHGSKETSCAFVRVDLLPGHKYMTSEVELGPEGIATILGIPKLSYDELRSFEAVLPLLQQDVDRGIYAGQQPLNAS